MGRNERQKKTKSPEYVDGKRYIMNILLEKFHSTV